VAQASRAVRALLPDPHPSVQVGTSLSTTWLANDERAKSHPDDAAAVLEGPDQVAFVTVPSSVDARVSAKGRVAVEGDWAGITDVWVSPDHRREGLGLVVMDALLEWAAEHGASTAYLQVRGDNAGGLALYDRLGFRTHHTYRYLAAPA
jgi:ribosomal protein S18 acetylase RimI-like enzyme